MSSILCLRSMTCGAALLAVLSAGVSSATPADDLRVYFKLDERITRSLYMGERLASPARYTTTVRKGTQLTVEAEARLHGRQVPATFKPEEGAPVTVSEGSKKRVLITANGCDVSSKLQVSLGERTAQLSLRTICKDGTIRAEIRQ